MLKGKQPIKEYDISCEKYRMYTVLSTSGAVIASIYIYKIHYCYIVLPDIFFIEYMMVEKLNYALLLE